MASRFVYFFGASKAEGRADMKNLLGGKGANLAEMTNLKLPVPPGFTISTHVCNYYLENKKKYPNDLSRQVEKALRKIERISGMVFGDAKHMLTTLHKDLKEL